MCAAVLLALSSSVFAQSAITKIDRLPPQYGSFSSLTRGADGRLYGLFLGLTSTARSAVFVLGDLSADPVPITVLHEFNQGEGALDGLALGTDGHLYGVTQRGGVNGRGTFFRLEADGTVTVLRSFSSTDLGTGGGLVQAGVTVGADGAFYGVAGTGSGEFERGAIFRLDAAGVFTIVKSFGFGTDGYSPAARLTLGPDGLLYGTTLFGSSYSSENGTVFRFNPTSGTLTRLGGFPAVEGASPGSRLLLASDGNLYGTTFQTTFTTAPNFVYRVGPSVPFQKVRALTTQDAPIPSGGLLEGADGYLYGVAIDRYSYPATAFRVSLAGAFELLHSFTATEVAPRSLLAHLPDGRWLGAGRTGDNPSAVFRLGTDFTYSAALRAVPTDQPAVPTAVIEYDGGLAGVARGGGIHGYGAIFHRQPSGGISTLHSFTYADGSSPSSPMAALHGNLYGTTELGGAFGCGTVFRRTAAGVLSTIHHFACEEGRPGAVTASRDGHVYGVTMRSGTGSAARIFKVDASGTYSVVEVFTAPATTSLSGDLVEGPDGRVYGSYGGGPGGFGAVFAIEPSGLVPVYVFTGGADAASPTHLAKGPGETLYGITFNPRRVFRITLSGAYTPLYDLAPGFFPRTTAVGLDGNYYIAGTESGGSWVFKVSPTGAFEKIPVNPLANPSVMAGSDGRLYGTAMYGSTSDSGAVFSITPVAIATTITAAAASGAFGGTTTVTATLSAPGGPIVNQVLTFTLNGAPVGTATTNTAGVATLPTVALTGIAPGVHPNAIGGSFAGTDLLTGTVAVPAALTVTAPSTTTVTASALSVDVLQPITFTATVNGTGGQPTGNVEFKRGTTVLGTAALTGSTATLTVNGLSSGAHAVTAAYVGDGGFVPSESAPLTVTVRDIALATFTIAFANGPAAVGTRPTIAAAVVGLGGSSPTGQVQFFDTALGLIGTANLVNGVATITPSGLAAGLHVIVARYAGTATLSPSTSTPVVLTVYSGAAPAATAVTLASSASPSTLGQPVTFTATVTPASGTPGGVVVFLADGVLLGTAPVSSTGGVHTAAVTTPALSRGAHVVVALFLGAPGFAASTSLPAIQVVQ